MTEPNEAVSGTSFPDAVRSEISSKLEAMYSLSEDVTLAKEDRNEKLASLSQSVSTAVDALQPQNSTDRALVLLWKGRCLDSVSEYQPEAEQLLSKAIKLDPSLVEGWNSLGNVYWKKKDMSGAKTCFEKALSRGNNKNAFRSLSIVLRNTKSEDPRELMNNITASVKAARDGLNMDVNDGKSWYILGNAYLSQFFVVSRDLADMDRALKAYQKADAIANHQSKNPDLYFNRANILSFNEDYQDAMNDYLRASKLDPSLPGEDKAANLQRFVQKVATLVESKCGLKAKKLQSLVSEIPAHKYRGYEPTTTQQLFEGANEKASIQGKYLAPIIRDTDVPASFVLLDKNSTACVVSVYNVTANSLDSLKVGDDIAILEPVLKTIKTSLPPLSSEDNKDADRADDATFRCIHVRKPQTFAVNGKTLQRGAFAAAQLSIETR